MALVCHNEVTQRKVEYVSVLDCNGKGILQQPLISCCQLVCKDGGAEMMHQVVQTALTVSGPFTCALLASATWQCQIVVQTAAPLPTPWYTGS